MEKIIIILLIATNLSLYAQINPIGDDTMVSANSNSCYFQPTPGKYVINGWVKEAHATTPMMYTNSSIEVIYGEDMYQTFTPEGAIIDGWQRIYGIFTIPDTATTLSIKLKATNTTITAYFDDIRVFPFNGNMKSFVYDPVTQRLMAELDENNYATLYEYDIEGGLVRVKKETERGIKTIQETRSGNAKGL